MASSPWDLRNADWYLHLGSTAAILHPHCLSKMSNYAPYPLPDQPETFNVGTLLAHRLQEVGIKDYFLVPGIPTMMKTVSA